MSDEDIADVLARRCCDATRSLSGYKNRSFRRLQLEGALEEIANIAATLFVGHTRTFTLITRSVFAEHPIEAGPEWIDRASAVIAIQILEVARDT